MLKKISIVSLFLIIFFQLKGQKSDDFIPNFWIEYPENGSEIPLFWSIPTELNAYVESFVLEQRESFIESIEVSTVLTGDSNKFTLPFDLTRVYPSLYSFRVRCNLNNGKDPVYSEYVEVFYNPSVVESIEELTGAVVQKDGIQHIHLQWPIVDNATEYRLFTSSISNPDELSWEASLPKITTNEFYFYVKSALAKEHSFAIASFDENGSQIGELSNTIKVLSASKKLFPVYIEEGIVTAKKEITLNWSYFEPLDLIGYNIYLDDKLIASPTSIGKGIKTFTTEVLTPGTFTLAIESVSHSNQVSDKESIIRTIF